MPDNLSVTISVEGAVKARQDIGLLQSGLRDLRAEHRQLADQMRQGIGDPARYAEVTRQILEQEKAVRELNRAQREHQQTTKESTLSFAEFGIELGHFAHAAGIAVEGIRALKFGFSGLVGALTIRQLKEVVDGLTAINTVSKETGASTQAIEAFRRAVEDAGGTAEQADSAYKGLAQAWSETGVKALEAGQRIDQQVQLVRGGAKGAVSDITSFGNAAVAVFHGAGNNIVQFGDVVKEVLRIDRTQFQQTQQDFDRFVVLIAQRIVALQDTGQRFLANEATRRLFSGQTFAQLGPALRQVAQSGSPEALGRLLDIRFTSREQIEAAEAYARSLRRLADEFENLKRAVIAPVLPGLAQALHGLTEAFRGLIPLLDEAAGLFNRIFGTHLAGADIIIVGLGTVLLRLLGIFRLLTAAVSGFGALFRALPAAVTALATTGGWLTLLRFIGPAGLLVAGAAALYAWLTKAGIAADETGKKTEDAAKAAADIVARGGREGQPAAPRSLVTPPAAAQPGETDEQYFRRTGFHYGARRGEASLGPAAPRVREIPIGVVDPTEAMRRRQQEAATSAADTSKKAADDIKENSKDAASGIGLIAEAWNTAAKANRDFIESSKQGLQSLIDKANEAAAAIAKAAPGSGAMAPSNGAPLTPPPPFAAGGYIRGAGTGTSDSILARLSNGEFVVNARSVGRLGLGFLSSLNRFAEGGFVDLPRLRFTDGGPVAAGSGGTPVHLHLGSQVFATTASQSVASALVSEAHRQAVTSAGVKPSWYAGRAGAV